MSVRLVNRVCLFTDSQEPSGVGAHMLTLAAGLRRRYRIVFCCPRSEGGVPLLERARSLGIDTVALERVEELAAITQTGPRLDRGFDIDILHVHAGIGWEGIPAVEFAREVGISVVLRTEHLPYLLTDHEQQAAHARAVQLVDRVICVSDGVRRSLCAAGASPHKLSVVRNGISWSQSRVDRDAVRRALGLQPGERLVLTVGRLEAQKGYQYLAEAVVQVVERQPHTRFYWVGEGSCRGQLQRQIQRLGIAGHVHLLGRRDDVPALLQSADLFVLPSLFEGLPLAVLEAMAAGLPVIGTRVCGTQETIRDGVTGRLVPPGDVDALALAILEALEQSGLAAGWGTAAQRAGAREFSARGMVRGIDRVYQECLGSVTPAPHTPAARRREQIVRRTRHPGTE